VLLGVGDEMLREKENKLVEGLNRGASLVM